MNLKTLSTLLPGIALGLAATGVSANSTVDSLFIDEQNEASYMVPLHEPTPVASSASALNEDILFVDERNENAYMVPLKETATEVRVSSQSYDPGLFIDELAEMSYL